MGVEKGGERGESERYNGFGRVDETVVCDGEEFAGPQGGLIDDVVFDDDVVFENGGDESTDDFVILAGAVGEVCNADEKFNFLGAGEVGAERTLVELHCKDRFGGDFPGFVT